MAFTFYSPPSLTPAQSGAMPDILGKILGGYEGVTKARYLQPSLEEELQKAKLFNKYYGPEKESEIGLRGAQAGHLGAMTEGLHISNPFLRKKLQDEQAQREYELQQKELLNKMLQQRLTGQQGQMVQSGQQIPQYNPGEGAPPFAQSEQSPFVQPEQSPFAQPEQFEQNSMNFNQAPQITNDDLINKKFFNIDTFAPKYKAYIDSITKNMNAKQAAQIKIDSEKSMADFKESSAAQKDLPMLQKTLDSAERMKEIIQSRPAFFGHWIAPGLFAKRSTDPLSGEFQALLVPQIAAMEKQLSEKGNQLALKSASQKLPGFDETQQSAMGKIDALIASIKAQIAHSTDLAGGNIVRRGNKRLKFIDGHWYELKKGDY